MLFDSVSGHHISITYRRPPRLGFSLARDAVRTLFQLRHRVLKPVRECRICVPNFFDKPIDRNFKSSGHLFDVYTRD